MVKNTTAEFMCGGRVMNSNSKARNKESTRDTTANTERAMKMRRYSIVFVIAALLLSSCGSTAPAPSNPQSSAASAVSTQHIDASASGQTTSSQAQTADVQDSIYEESKDLKVIAAYTYDKHCFILVENKSSKPILEFVLEYIGFDRNGFSVGGISRGRKSDANMLPGDKLMVGYYESDIKHVSATVVEIKFADGETWKAKNNNAWAEDAKSTFSVNDYNDLVYEFEELAVLAETNQYLQGSWGMTRRNQFSSSPDFDLNLTNTSEETIQKFSVKVLQFDANGMPVSTSPYDTYKMNDNGSGGIINLTSGASISVTSNLFFEPSCVYFKVCISEIEFANGDYWTNPYVYEWLLFNADSYRGQ